MKQDIKQSMEGVLAEYYDDPHVYEVAYKQYVEDVLENDVSDQAKNFFYQMMKVIDEVKQNKLDTIDFFEPSNLGYKGENLAFFDFGGRYHKPLGKKKPKELKMAEGGDRLNENPQQMEKKYGEALTPEDKKSILSITNGDHFTRVISDIYAWLMQISPYDRGQERREKPSEYEIKAIKFIYDELKNYDKNIFPIEGFEPANTNEHPLEIWAAIRNRGEIKNLFSKIPSKYLRNLKNEVRKPIPIRLYDYYLKNESSKIRNFLKKLESLSEEKQEKILNKVFSSKNNSFEKLINHIENTEVLFLSHEEAEEEIRNSVRELEGEAKILYDNNNILVVNVLSSDAMKVLGCGSLWCFTTEYGTDHWENYANNSHVNLVYNFNEPNDSKRRMVVVLPSGEVYNMYNEHMPIDSEDIDGWEYLESIGVEQYINHSEPVNERITTWMPKAKAVKVKKKCVIGGNGDGTSTACNQGDINNLEINDIDDDNKNRRKDNTTNVAEKEESNRYYFSEIIKEELKKTLLNEEKVQFGCLMLYFNIPNWNKIINKIKEEDLYNDGSGTFGRECDPHISILYGFHDEVNADDFKKIIEDDDISKYSVKVKGVSLFENEQFDVVKLDIEPTEELISLRNKVKKLPNTLTYKDFKPHMTVAYVKSGEGYKYKNEWEKEVLLKPKNLVYSTATEKKTTLVEGKKKILNELMKSSFELPPFKIKNYDVILNGNVIGKTFISEKQIDGFIHYDLSEIKILPEYR